LATLDDRRKHAYTMRMTRVNISVPADLVMRAKAAGLNISQLASGAVAGELDRLAKLAALDSYLSELEAELGPVPPEEAAAAKQWANDVFGVDPAESESTQHPISA